MPIVTIHLPLALESNRTTQLASDVRSAGARALGCGPDNIWVVIHQPGGESDADVPPFVFVRATAGRSAAVRTEFARAVTEVLAQALRRPATEVWLHYDELRPEDVWWKSGWAR